MYWKKKYIAMFLCGMACATSFAQPVKSMFTSAEHLALGERVKLHFIQGDEGQLHSPLHLANGLVLPYGGILAMADYYGVVGKPISMEEDETKREARFIAAFETLAVRKEAVEEALGVQAIIDEELKYILDGMKNGENEEDLYEKTGLDLDRQYNCATGGGCQSGTWWANPGRYLQLAQENFDHFADHALLAYKTGHRLAVKTALAAHLTHDKQGLETAYAMNAFASHFLSDRFSPGHMRTPRKELYDNVTPSLVGSLLSIYMHNEESFYGLNVHNNRGEHWLAFGDKSYFSEKTAEHRERLHAVLQASVDEIFSAWQYGIAPQENSVDEWLPIPDDANDPSDTNIATMFYWDADKQILWRRADLTNPYDKRWTDSWWGWSTLIELNGGASVPFITQAQLAQSSMAAEAVKAGLITNKDLIAWIGNKK